MADAETIAPRGRGRPPVPRQGQINLNSPLFQNKMTIEQVATDSNRSIPTVRRWVHEGLRVDALGLIDIDDFKSFIAKRGKQKLAPPRRRSRNRGR